jgi:hypothetical protein
MRTRGLLERARLTAELKETWACAEGVRLRAASRVRAGRARPERHDAGRLDV